MLLLYIYKSIYFEELCREIQCLSVSNPELGLAGNCFLTFCSLTVRTQTRRLAASLWHLFSQNWPLPLSWSLHVSHPRLAPKQSIHHCCRAENSNVHISPYLRYLGIQECHAKVAKISNRQAHVSTGRDRQV